MQSSRGAVATPPCGLLDVTAGNFPQLEGDNMRAFYRRQTYQQGNKTVETRLRRKRERAEFETVRKVMALKRRSLFCIEPEGLYPRP